MSRVPNTRNRDNGNLEAFTPKEGTRFIVAAAVIVGIIFTVMVVRSIRDWHHLRSTDLIELQEEQ